MKLNGTTSPDLGDGIKTAAKAAVLRKRRECRMDPFNQEYETAESHHLIYLKQRDLERTHAADRPNDLGSAVQLRLGSSSWKDTC